LGGQGFDRAELPLAMALVEWRAGAFAPTKAPASQPSRDLSFRRQMSYLGLRDS